MYDCRFEPIPISPIATRILAKVELSVGVGIRWSDRLRRFSAIVGARPAAGFPFA